MGRNTTVNKKSIPAHADGPRDAASRSVDHRAVDKTGRRLWSTGDNRPSMLKALGAIRRRRQVIGCLRKTSTESL